MGRESRKHGENTSAKGSGVKHQKKYTAKKIKKQEIILKRMDIEEVW
jgi:hypothetical protein